MQIHRVAGISDNVSFVKTGQQCEMKYHPGGQGESVRNYAEQHGSRKFKQSTTLS